MVYSVKDIFCPLLLTMSTSQSLAPLGLSTVADTPVSAAGETAYPPPIRVGKAEDVQLSTRVAMVPDDTSTGPNVLTCLETGPGGPGSPLSPLSPLGPASPCGPCGPCGPTAPNPAGPCGPGGPCSPWRPWLFQLILCSLRAQAVSAPTIRRAPVVLLTQAKIVKGERELDAETTVVSVNEMSTTTRPVISVGICSRAPFARSGEILAEYQFVITTTPKERNVWIWLGASTGKYVRER